MSDNITSLPYYQTYYIQVEQPMETVGINQNPTPIEIIESNAPELTNPQNINNTTEKSCIFQVVSPQELNLIPVNNFKRGRPRKKPTAKNSIVIHENVQIVPPFSKQNGGDSLKKAPRTRSGRLIKLPKHIQANFKKIDISTDETDVRITDFKRYDEKENTKKVEFLELKQQKRNISSQYRCPKCFKAYLGKTRMIEHIKKYPDHADQFSDNQIEQKQNNFDVWNYLFDITQKCKTGQRGVKFCEELTNLLHNLQLLKSTLFKSINIDEEHHTNNIGKDCVFIDKVLGNAIGLPPGKYKFNENELYKDVTILRLINSDFFKSTHRHDEIEHCNKKFKQDPVIGTYSKRVDDDDTNLLNDDLTILTDNNNSNDMNNEIMLNVDRFVNERFKNIVEPDLELNNLNSNQSLNFDLSNLELFQFHTS